MARTILLLSFLGVCALGTGCRTFEGMGNDINRGLRDTQQDLEHGIRGGPDGEPAEAQQQEQPAAQPQPAVAQPQPAQGQPQPGATAPTVTIYYPPPPPPAPPPPGAAPAPGPAPAPPQGGSSF